MNDEQYMRRCFNLALLGAGKVSPNPMVGAVLVYEDRIIGEGWHQKYGEAHAEVQCIRSVSIDDQQYIPSATLYCSLEPCFHFGKTPPCVDLILAQKIPRVVVSNVDPNPKVSGQSLAKLRAAGVKVTAGILEDEGRRLNRTFFTWITQRRPYIILKWAQSDDGYIGKPGERTPISGPAALRLTHRWRSEADAILVGTTTALTDDPRLDTRFYFGKNPLRIVLDRHQKLPAGFHLFDDSTETWVFGPERPGEDAQEKIFSRTKFFPTESKLLISDLLGRLYEDNRSILYVEGGSNLLNQFLTDGYWDEIRMIENTRQLSGGIAAPRVPANAELSEQFKLAEDEVHIFVCTTPPPAPPPKGGEIRQTPLV